MSLGGVAVYCEDRHSKWGCTVEDWQDSVDLAALQTWMDHQGLGRGDISPPRALGGGTQNVVVKFERDGRTYVLRRPPVTPRAGSNDTMRREMRMLAALAGTAVPHPGLIASCPEEDVLGVAFYLMEPVEGFTPTTGLPDLHAGDPALRRRMGMALIDGITALGAVDHHAVGLGDFGNPDNYLDRQVARWRRQLKSYEELAGWPGPAAIPGVEKIARWLDAHKPGSFEPGIIHGDYHLGNVMYRHDGPELAAIVDWELTTIGDPLLDLGWVLATWPGDGEMPVPALSVTPWEGFPGARELVARYRAGTDRNLEAIDWYAVLACYKLGIILEGTYARACAGHAPMATGEMLHQSTVQLFERALRWIR